MLGLKYKEFIEELSKICKDDSIDDSTFLHLKNEKEDEYKIGYIISPLEREVYMDGNLYLQLVKGVQVRLDDLTKVLTTNALIASDTQLKRLVGYQSKEVYVCKSSKKNMKKLLEVLPIASLEEIEMAADYGYGKEDSTPSKRKIKFYNTYKIYKPLLETLKRTGYGIYEVKYRREVDLQEILDGEIPIGFESIRRVFPTPTEK